MIYSLEKENLQLNGMIPLAGSKSISNRVLIIRALSESNFSIQKLASSKDTHVLDFALSNLEASLIDVGPAGTSFRFLTAFLSLQKGTQQLTGSKRMLERPIGPLVDALRHLGADISYEGKDGYPPLKIGPWAGQKNKELSIPANISSQFISALLLIAPSLENGLSLTLDGKIVSRPYIEMTLGLMKEFGVESNWENQLISIAPQSYQGKDFEVEADWSAASYYYAMAAIAKEPDLELQGLRLESWQGDSAIVQIMAKLGITTTATEKGIRLQRSHESPPIFEFDFLKCPDLAQTVIALCGALGIHGLFSGLETLRIKETDRIKALQDELMKLSVFLSPMPAKFSKKQDKEFFVVEGKAVLNEPRFATYHDHRMAMAFAPLAMLGKIEIEDPTVVEKSYPEFWDHLKSLGFEGKELSS